MAKQQQEIEAQIDGQVQIDKGPYKGKLAMIEAIDEDKGTLDVRVLDHGEGYKAIVKQSDVTVLRGPDEDSPKKTARATKKAASSRAHR